MGFFSDFLSNPLDTLGNVGQKLIDNPIPAITAYATGNPTALLAYGAPTNSGGGGGTGQLNQGLLSTAGSYLQNQSNVAGNNAAAQSSQFRPVGITNNFGTSNFGYDANGNLTSAGYNLNPQLQSAQTSLMGGIPQTLQDQARIQAMGRQYMTQSPQEQAQQYIANQQALLASSREQQSANLMNQLSNSGRTGLSVAQGGNLGMANPEYQALANARAQQDLQLAADATQAGQKQYQFGQGLLSSAYDPYTANLKASGYTEGLGQQPFDISTALGAKQSTAGANAAGYLKSAGQTNTLAQILGGASGNNMLSGIFGNILGGNNGQGVGGGITSSGMMTPTYDIYGTDVYGPNMVYNTVPLGYANL
jgi:hypothetical protein